jgi:hypothetical protein
VCVFSDLQVASNTWCDTFRKAASVKLPDLPGGDRPEHDVRFAYVHCLIAEAAFQSLRHDDVATDVDVTHGVPSAPFRTLLRSAAASRLATSRPATASRPTAVPRPSSHAGGIVFGVMYMARLVARLITTEESDGAGLQQAAITRLHQRGVLVGNDVPRWEAVGGGAQGDMRTFIERFERIRPPLGVPQHA